MIIISHRGNLNGPSEIENTPFQIEEAIKLGFDVEIDIWKIDNKLYLGHDQPTTEVSIEFLNRYHKQLWIHCKNVDALYFFNGDIYNCFYHNTDDVVLTSFKVLWTYPGKQLTNNSVAVMPDIIPNGYDWVKNSSCFAVCTDYPFRYSK
jgi:hypothetical protein